MPFTRHFMYTFIFLFYTVCTLRAVCDCICENAHCDELESRQECALLSVLQSHPNAILDKQLWKTDFCYFPEILLISVP